MAKLCLSELVHQLSTFESILISLVSCLFQKRLVSVNHAPSATKLRRKWRIITRSKQNLRGRTVSTFYFITFLLSLYFFASRLFLICGVTYYGPPSDALCLKSNHITIFLDKCLCRDQEARSQAGDQGAKLLPLQGRDPSSSREEAWGDGCTEGVLDLDNFIWKRYISGSR